MCSICQEDGNPLPTTTWGARFHCTYSSANLRGHRTSCFSLIGVVRAPSAGAPSAYGTKSVTPSKCPVNGRYGAIYHSTSVLGFPQCHPDFTAFATSEPSTTYVSFANGIRRWGYLQDIALPSPKRPQCYPRSQPLASHPRTDSRHPQLIRPLQPPGPASS